ncbi:MAG: bifunctional 5,10-methylenetetrahydrofolate dehydrogenase/5,10-methenyltetrahydrofolate cyclohydrolase [Clostridiales bacterium]|jgi:methylenetetrahydrofolate dehydrogenase (NADP+)/methenyltetrahydrofolate cyclohydrolase|nr:bifunctional 5,10-methylenetetrahydrofolate dehydrogenase/5,10-methenyltetrahydrofolate cyclohydrolase [Clostridiales bacterium]
MAKVLYGKEVTQLIEKRILSLIKGMAEKPCLGLVRVGARPDDLYYQSSLEKACARLGLTTRLVELEDNISQDRLEAAITAAGEDNTINGILLFSPLSGGLDSKKAGAAIPPAKDVDGLSFLSQAGLFSGHSEVFPPCTPAAVLELLDYYQIPLAGQEVVVVGRSQVVGKPLAMMLLARHATVTICHSKTRDLPSVCRRADIVVAAIGRAKMLGADYFRSGQVVIDVGINDDPERPGRICGDVDFAAVEPLVGQITPVPGGIGGITSALICWQTVKAIRNS